MNETMVFPKISLFAGSFVVKPKKSSTIDNEFNDCLIQLNQILQNYENTNAYVIKQNYFVNISDKIYKNELFKYIQEQTQLFFGLSIPLSIIPQEPLNDGIQIIAEYTYISNVNSKSLEVKWVDNIPYLTVDSAYGKILVAAGLNQNISNTNILSQSIAAFELAEKILQSENMDFGHIIRQWNYIENIIGFSNNNQHYQIFNDVRTNFYSKSSFNHGYPAATGIGMNSDGVIIDFIALLPSNQTQIIPLHSPVQANAHQYSEHLLAETDIHLKLKKTTPKFERGKVVFQNGKGALFVSGTAAIKGELSINQQNGVVQTELTLKNIQNLISHDNLQRHGIEPTFQLIPSIYRIYIKNPHDYLAIKNYIRNKLINVDVIFLHADVCRPELLVEIEAIFHIA